MRKTLLFAIAALFLAGTSLLVNAGPGGGRFGGGPGGPLGGGPGGGPLGGGPHHPHGPGGPGAPLPPPTTPAGVAERCVDFMTVAAGIANGRMHVVATFGVAAINNLQSNENEDEAIEVADLRTDMINASADWNTTRIEMVSEHCLETLADMEAEDALVTLVETIRDELIASIAQHRTDELQRIADALAD